MRAQRRNGDATSRPTLSSSSGPPTNSRTSLHRPDLLLPTSDADLARTRTHSRGAFISLWASMGHRAWSRSLGHEPRATRSTRRSTCTMSVRRCVSLTRRLGGVLAILANSTTRGPGTGACPSVLGGREPRPAPRTPRLEGMVRDELEGHAHGVSIFSRQALRTFHLAPPEVASVDRSAARESAIGTPRRSPGTGLLSRRTSPGTRQWGATHAINLSASTPAHSGETDELAEIPPGQK